MRFLIVDDDPKSSLLLKRFLEEEAFAVDHATETTRGVLLTRVNQYDLVIVNQTSPGGFSAKICSELRTAERPVPVIGVFSINDLEHRLEFLSAGADDCLVRPFSLRELLVRIRAVLRRGSALRADLLTAGGIILNCRTQRVRLRGKLISLSRKEFSLLELLMRNRGCIVSRSVILEHVWDMTGNPFSNSLDAHICSLRKKLGKERDAIRNVQGRGYVIED